MGVKWTIYNLLRSIRRFVVKLTLIAAISFICVIAIWKGFRADIKLKYVIEEQLAAVTTDSMVIGSLQLFPTTLQLQDVVIYRGGEQLLSIVKCKVRFSLFGLINSQGNWANTIYNVELINPQLIIRQSDSSKSIDLRSNLYSKQIYQKFKLITPLSKIEITNGSAVTASDKRDMFEEINIEFATSVDNKLQIHGNGKLSIIAGTEVNCIGEIDIPAEELLLDITINNRDMSNMFNGDATAESAMLSNIKGWFQGSIEIRGRDQLVVTGNMVAHDFELNYGESIRLGLTKFNAQLFGASVNFEADAILNGLKIPLHGEVTDVFNQSWQLTISEDGLNISDFNWSKPERSFLSGYVDLKADIIGKNSGYQGTVSVKSKSAKVKSIPINDITVELSIEDGITLIDNFHASIYGSEVELGGFVNMASGENRIDWFVDKVVTFDKKYSWLGLDSNYVSVVGALSGISGEVIGSGNCEILNSMGEKLIAWNFDIDGYQIFGQFETVQTDVSGEFQVDLSHSQPTVLITGKNPHRIIKSTKYGKFVNDKFHQYVMDYRIEGDLKNYDYSLKLAATDDENSLSIKGNIDFSDPKRLSLIGSLDLIMPPSNPSTKILNRKLSGGFKFVYEGDRLTIINMDLWGESGDTLATVIADIGMKNSSSNNLDLRLFELPILDIFRFFYPDRVPALVGMIGGSLTTHGLQSDYNFHCSLKTKNIPPYNLRLNGNADGKKISIDNLSLENDESRKMLGLKGAIDLSTLTVDGMTISADDLNLDHILTAISNSDSSSFGGSLNLLAHVEGNLPFPSIDMNAHIAGASIHNMDGFWGNLHLVSDDSTYSIQKMDIGLRLKKMAEIDGYFYLNSKKYNFDMLSTEHDVKDFVQLLTGRSNIISGDSHIRANINNNDLVHKLSVDVVVNSGNLGKMGFDELYGSFLIDSIGTKFVTLSIDTLGIDWGNFAGRVSGIVPLNPIRKLKVSGGISGEIMSFLPRISGFFSKPIGGGSFEFKAGGTIKELYIERANLRISNGSIKLKDIVSEVTSLDINLTLDSTGVIDVLDFHGEVEGNPFYISNRFPVINEVDTTYSFTENQQGEIEQSIVINRYNLGIIQFATAEKGIWARIPGLMEREWGGYFIFSGMDESTPIEFSGPASKPFGTGKIKVRKALITYPFVQKKGLKLKQFPAAIVSLLTRMDWEAQVVPEWGCNYVREISGLKDMPFYDEFQKNVSSSMFNLDLKLYLDLELDPSPEGLYFSGSIADSFQIAGELRSTRGNIEYLDMKFSANEIKAEFNQSDLNPLIYGSAVTTIIDTAGIPRDIRIETRRIAGEGAGGIKIIQDAPARWENLKVVFEDDQNDSQEHILALLGYAPETLDKKLPGLGGSIVERAVPIKRYTRKLERQLERWLNVDRIDIDPTVTQNIIQQQISAVTSDFRYGNQDGNYLQVFDQSSVSLGKYITRDIYVSYTGLLRNSADKYNFTRLGMLHNWDLLLRLWQIAPDLNFNYRYQYDSIAEHSDQSFRIRINFTFDI